MASELQQYVLDNVWCTPGQDNQLNNRPRKIHSANAAFINFYYLNRFIPLPNKTSGWFIYDMGSLFEFGKYLPFYYKDWENEQWTQLSVPLIRSNILTTLSTLKGVTFPLFRSFYIYTKEKTLLIAVENNDLIPADLTTEDLYIKIYSNSFFNSTRNTDIINNKFSTGGTILTSLDNLKPILNAISYFRFQPGYCFVNVNGKRYRNTIGSFINIGDYIEYIYDPTVDHVETLFLGSLLSYPSISDSDNKYILNTRTNEYFTSIGFRDDLEIDIFTPITPNEGIGLHYPIVDKTSIRMLTHRSYSIRESIVTEIVNKLRSVNPSNSTFAASIEIKFRKSGYKRDLVTNTSYAQDLHLLPFVRTNEAYIQDPVEFEPFLAYNLEQGIYAKAMNGPIANFTDEFTKDFLGLNGLIKTFGLEPILANSTTMIDVPSIYNEKFTVYEYNSSGRYLENHSVNNLSNYLPNNPLTGMVEIISGEASTGPSVSYGYNNLSYIPSWSYRVYACDIISGTPQYNWSDITNTTDYVLNTTTNLFQWTNSSDPRYMMIRDDSKFVIKDLNITFNDQLLTFQLTEQVDLNQGAGLQTLPLQVAPSDIVLFLNERSLVRGLDYFIDFPNIYITNFKYLNQSGPQIFHYRLNGLGLNINQLDPTLDIGLVSHGFIGTNNKYVPKNDKSLRVTIDGYLTLRSNYKFSQDNVTTVDAINNNNGLPYQIQHMAVSVTNLLNNNQELIRDRYVNLDWQLSSFMTPRLRFFNRGFQSLPNGRYQLVCPFFCRIIDEILNGTISGVQLDPGQTDSQISNTVANYINLIQFGPCNPSLSYIGNDNYIIRPTSSSSVVHLGTQNAIIFISRVAAILTPGAINNIGNYITI